MNVKRTEKAWKRLAAGAMAACLLGTLPLSLSAREPNEPPRSEDSPGRGRDDAPNIKHHGTQVGRSGKEDGTASGRPDVLPSDVKVLIEKFKADREKFLKQQQELERQLKQDGQANREALREQLKASLDRWKEQQKEFRDQLKERTRGLSGEVREMDRVITSGSGGGSGGGHHGRGGGN